MVIAKNRLFSCNVMTKVDCLCQYHAEETTVFDRWTPITSTNNHRAILARAAVSCFRHERIDDISSDLMTLRRGVIWHFMQDPPSSFVARVPQPDDTKLWLRLHQPEQPRHGSISRPVRPRPPHLPNGQHGATSAAPLRRFAGLHHGHATGYLPTWLGPLASRLQRRPGTGDEPPICLRAHRSPPPSACPGDATRPANRASAARVTAAAPVASSAGPGAARSSAIPVPSHPSGDPLSAGAAIPDSRSFRVTQFRRAIPKNPGVQDLRIRYATFGGALCP